ncbi:pleckstrin homology domain-containing family G member 1 isoform X1 [Eublepharis macularius]|uniref:Pleckstrin homology domain-containing family G member 1 isoform X1 n=1 Tax=Eublepharis macularius TaxID=481883 RepID=A0AA97KHH3_EUBMA|nr:pleckstrin homology domain-containing family G member 1 isoform X1 [Eublepharis macularius]
MVGTTFKATGADLHKENQQLHYLGIQTMELSDSDRPVSFSSTSSSASSRDSHCSFGSRTTLVSNNHLGLFNHAKEAGAIRLELSPAHRFSSKELQKNNPVEQQTSEGSLGRRPNMPRKVESKETSKNCVMSLITEPTSPKLLYVDRVVQEILDTERTYVQDLKSIVKDYLDCITDQSKLSLGPEERSALFGNIKDIYHFNSELLQDLENCENDPVAIAECFVSKSEDFHIYTQYCTNYPRSVAVLTECMRNKSLAKFFREQQEALQHSLPLGSYLLKPVQRILKYHLLLHEIENHLDKDTEGYDVVLDAIDTMQRVAWHINDMKRKHEHAIRLQEIQSLLTNWKGPDLTSYGELVLEGTFRIQGAKNERTLFLFDKLLLITKKREEMFTYKAHILCGNLMLVEVIPKEPLSFSVFHYKNPKMQHTVQAKSQQDKRLWILHLKRLILENHPAKIPAKAKQAILEMDATYHPGFHYSPEGEMKALSNSKEGITPQRVRRKSEPSSRVHKIIKPNEMDPDIQKVSFEESSQVNTSLPFSTGGGSHTSREFIPQNSSFMMNILGRTAAVRNIWTDHQIRQALFPSRRLTQETVEDEDDYQMFVPSISASNLAPVACEERVPSTRPCSWHVGLAHQSEASSSNSHRIVRRASSAGERRTSPCATRYRKNDLSQNVSWSEIKHSRSDMDNLQVYPESSEELTIDDVDHVYDNISFEDLKLMGLVRREESDHTPQGSARDSLYETQDQEVAFKKRQPTYSRTTIPPNRKEALGRSSPSVSSHDLRISEENIYDTILLPEQSLLNFKCDHLKCSKHRSFLGLETDFVCCDHLRQFVSEESLQFSEDESPYHYVPLDHDYLNLLDSSSNSDSLSHKSAADKLSEEVDEIWNDLENYIKKNEEKTRDHVLAAFPVSKDDIDNTHTGTTCELNEDGEYSLSTLSLPETPAFPQTPSNRVARLSETNLRFEEPASCKSNSLLSLNRSSFSNEVAFVNGLSESAHRILCNTNTECGDSELDAVDKTKNRVFMMARQYSQKIKKANQLLKVKSPEQEQLLSRQQKLRHKDLAAILEEKKQGGPAIGARIAEYSQLYDQIIFRETSPKTHKVPSQETSNVRYSSPVSTSQLAAECLRAEDWILHSAYSNGELSDFSAWPEGTPPLKSKSSPSEMSSKQIMRQLPTACSVPSLQTPPHRWSAIISQPNKENLHHSHVYNSLERKESNEKAQTYIRSQLSSSVGVIRSREPMNYPHEKDKKHLYSSRNFICDQYQESVPTVSPGPAECGETRQMPESCSEMILQDSQKVLRVNRHSLSNAQIATQNYFSNFKDTEGDGDEDDDYVEIKSEDEGSDFEASHGHPKLLDPKINAQSTPSEAHGGRNMTKPPDSYLTTYSESDKLNDYLWRVPSPNQQNIVQSLREKFQCLSSSSFA